MLADGGQEFPSFFLSLKGTVSNHDETGAKPKLNRPLKICNTCETGPWKGGLTVDRFSTQAVFRKFEVAPNRFGTAVHLVHEATVTASDMPIVIVSIQRSEADSKCQCCAESDRQQCI